MLKQLDHIIVSQPKKPQPKCGIIMPISTIDNCSSDHWAEVLNILKDAIESSNFESNLVSDADDIGVIQKRIIQNLYDNEIVVCDVSCKNPNVMFELGMRLAFDKPTIIIKDDQTDYTFDTSVIEHLTYPRDLRFTKIVEFKVNLKKKIEATYNRFQQDPSYSTFLKNFGQYKISTLEEKEVSSNEFILNSLLEIKSEISKIKTNGRTHLDFEKERTQFLHLSMERYAVKKGIRFDALYEHLEELIEQLSNNDQIKNMFVSNQSIKDYVLEVLPPPF